MKRRIAFGLAATLALVIIPTACNMNPPEPLKPEEASVETALSASRCEEEAERTSRHAHDGHGSDDDAERAWGHRFIDCSIDTHSNGCDAEGLASKWRVASSESHVITIAVVSASTFLGS